MRVVAALRVVVLVGSLMVELVLRQVERVGKLDQELLGQSGLATVCAATYAD